MMTPHGPDSNCFSKASQGDLVPQRIAEGTQAFMFEVPTDLSLPLSPNLILPCLFQSSLSLGLTEWAVSGCGRRDTTYNSVWSDVPVTFDPSKK